MIIPRNMRIDFADAPLIWSRNQAFATIINAGSAAAVAFEGYLAKVMARARDELGDRNPAVTREIDLFIAQEGHHYRVHKAYNKRLYARYPKARAFEAELSETLRIQLETRSLAYNLAFSAGFENFACYMAKYQFTRGLAYFEGADRRMATLWLWHAAEEFEHRTACN
ncbi:MAG: metal-dependent hydrolase, partial [Sphingomonadales bacterium]